MSSVIISKALIDYLVILSAYVCYVSRSSVLLFPYIAFVIYDLIAS